MLTIKDRLTTVKGSIYRSLGINGQGRNLQKSFIFGVLLPPFIVLMVLSAAMLWQLDRIVKNQAIDNLSRAAGTTAAKIEREFSIRQTVLEKTGQELFTIKSGYHTSLDQLTVDENACSTYVSQTRKFQGAPNNVCNPFLTQFASEGITAAAVKDGYVTSSNELTTTESRNINDRLSAFKDFFPETVGLMVLDSGGNVVSSAYSGSFSDPDSQFLAYAKAALKTPQQGIMLSTSSYRLAIFAYPITGGSVLAAYDLDSVDFLKNSWQSTPIDKQNSFTAVLDGSGNLAYPDLNIAPGLIKSENTSLRHDKDVSLRINNIENIAAAAKAGTSNWLVVVASPQVAVLAPEYDAQFVAVFIIGCLLIGFLWVGTFYIRRSLRSVYGLVGGALVFAGGQLDYKIHLSDADDEYTRLAETMNSMAERIAKAEKEIDEKNKEFISVATHELRAPLTAIIGYLSMIIEDMGSELSANVKPLIEQVNAGTIRLRDLINDMLDVARLESGRTEFKIVAIDIGQLADNIVESMRIVAVQKPVSLNYDKTNAQFVMADEAHLRIILNNFVSNAIKYNRANGTINISHELKDSKLITKIADTGLGIPDDQKAHMFEKFFRVNNDDRKTITGTGLGMYITKQYITAMHGELWFESVHGQGTTFFFSLPLAAHSSLAAAASSRPAGQTGAGT